MEDGESDSGVAKECGWRTEESRLNSATSADFSAARGRRPGADDRRLAELARIFADDYVQYNESGKAFTKQDVLDNFRTGAIRYPSIVSTGRRIRVFGDTAVVHGRNRTKSRTDGKRSLFATFTWMCCESGMGSGNWWLRSCRSIEDRV